jgi:hypothetical protein
MNDINNKQVKCATILFSVTIERNYSFQNSQSLRSLEVQKTFEIICRISVFLFIFLKYCNVLGVLYSRWNFIALQKSIHYS